jgi:hypothetical protein
MEERVFLEVTISISVKRSAFITPFEIVYYLFPIGFFSEERMIAYEYK